MRTSGPFTDRDYLAALNAILEHPAREPAYHEVWDLREVTLISFAPSVLQHYHHLMQHMRTQGTITRGRVAIIGRQADLRMLTVLFTQLARRYVDRESRLFRTVIEAEAWLGLPADCLAQIKQAPAIAIHPDQDPRSTEWTTG
ncbi:MAG: hypothetical protein RhofKO_25030 [Rhodothermales bacterium]